MTEVISDTLKELGLEELNALNRFIFLRVDKEPEKSESGLLFIPPKQKFWTGKGAEVILRGTVISVGPDCKQLKVGDKAIFRRFELAWWRQLNDFSYIGMVDETFIVAKEGN